nr:uncharacterized protein LOC101251236 [Solanum lycopersicum]
MVRDTRSRMSLFVAGLEHISRKKVDETMLIGDKEISRLMIYVKQVEKEKLRDREEFKHKRAKTGNEFGQQKSNDNRVVWRKGEISLLLAKSVIPIFIRFSTKEGASRGSTSGTSGGTNLLYALNNCEEQEDLPDVGTALAERVYRDYLVSVNRKSTMTDLIELDMVDFDVILGMDWLDEL